MPKIVDHQLRRQELLAATWRVIARTGIIGVTTREMMSIFQAMKRAGALQAELVLN